MKAKKYEINPKLVILAKAISTKNGKLPCLIYKAWALEAFYRLGYTTESPLGFEGEFAETAITWSMACIKNARKNKTEWANCIANMTRWIEDIKKSLCDTERNQN